MGIEFGQTTQWLRLPDRGRMRFKTTVRPIRPSYIQREAVKRLIAAFKEAGIEPSRPSEAPQSILLLLRQAGLQLYFRRKFVGEARRHQCRVAQGIEEAAGQGQLR